MARVQLTGGYYRARSLIAGAQRCVNLYPEKNEPDSPTTFTDYPTPGLRLLANPPVTGPARGIYTASSGNLYYACGNALYFVDSGWTFALIGTLATSAGMVSMWDNGSDMLVADGSPFGYTVNLGTQAFATIGNGDNFYGATRLDGLDSYTLGNIPGTRTFFSSDLNALTFDPLYIANKSGAPDLLVVVVVVNREIWLLGQKTAEIFYNSGSADFPFQIMSGPFIQYGCAAAGSVARQGSTIFWLAQDASGGRTVLAGKGYEAHAISTQAMDDAIRKYAYVGDAVAFCYQQEGHQFYILTFPSADATWCFDFQTGLWHERTWTDSNGTEHRIRAQCGAYAYGVNVVGDWETGALYALDLDAETDNGQPIVRRRGFPHMIQNANRQVFSQFIADLAVGGSVGTTGTAPPLIFLRWSDDRGVTWGNAVDASMGATGDYLASVQWQRLGMARDRVFELFWSEPAKTALQGAFVRVQKLGS